MDIRKTPTPIVEGLRWMYVDLVKFSEYLRSGFPLPEQLASLESSFDLVTGWEANIGRDVTVLEFLTKPNGFWITDYDHKPILDSGEILPWQRLSENIRASLSGW